MLAEAASRNALDDMIGISETIADLLKAEPTPRSKPNVKRAPKRDRKVPTNGIEAALAGASDPIEALQAAGLSKSVKEAIGE